jgi:hypothetical protein
MHTFRQVWSHTVHVSERSLKSFNCWANWFQVKLSLYLKRWLLSSGEVWLNSFERRGSSARLLLWSRSTTRRSTSSLKSLRSERVNCEEKAAMHSKHTRILINSMIYCKSLFWIWNTLFCHYVQDILRYGCIIVHIATANIRQDYDIL